MHKQLTKKVEHRVKHPLLTSTPESLMPRTIQPRYYLPFFVFISLLPGCQSSFGPQSIDNTRASYNQAIADTSNQQMLLNLVRLKYKDEMFFLKVGSVTSTFTYTSNIGVGSTSNFGASSFTYLPKDSVSPSLGISYSDIPTISYQPLQGEDFFKSVLSPISLDRILVLIQSGWNIERVFSLCVERVNDLHNSPNLTDRSENKKFSAILKLLRTLQLSHSIEVGLSQDNLHLIMLFKPTADNWLNINELQSLLGVKNNEITKNLFTISSDFLNVSPNQITIQTRGINTVMHYLAQTVVSPEEHIKAGLVEDTFSNSDADNLFRVNVSASRPTDAFITVPYNGYWFYIADNDLHSKSAFMLLSQLFDLQSGQTVYAGPTLTLPVR